MHFTGLNNYSHHKISSNVRCYTITKLTCISYMRLLIKMQLKMKSSTWIDFRVGICLIAEHLSFLVELCANRSFHVSSRYMGTGRIAELWKINLRVPQENILETEEMLSVSLVLIDKDLQAVSYIKKINASAKIES